MSGRIGKRFELLREQGRKAFIPYIMAGDPDLKTTESLVHLLEECGADVIELGVPFSDPLADGPTIQMAAERALSKGTNLTKVLRTVSAARKKTDLPIALMTYYNPIFRYGEKKFVEDAVNAGVDGGIIPDLPPDEGGRFNEMALRKGLDVIFLLSPTSTDERIRLASRASRGFVYYVSMTGITGSRLSIDRSIRSMVRKIRAVSGKPVCVGFGVSTPREAEVISKMADGVIIGSAIVKKVNASPSGLKRFLKGLRKAI